MKKRKVTAVFLAAAMMASLGVPVSGAEFTDGEQAEASVVFSDQNNENQITGLSENAKDASSVQSYYGDDEDENEIPQSISIVKGPKQDVFWTGLDYMEEGLDYWGLRFEVTYASGNTSQVEIGWDESSQIAWDQWGNIYEICLLNENGQKVSGEPASGDYECVIRFNNVESNSIPIQVLKPDQAPELKQDISKSCTTEVKVAGRKAVAKFTPQYDVLCNITVLEEDVTIQIVDSDFNSVISEELKKGKTYYIYTYNTDEPYVTFKTEYKSGIASIKFKKEPTIKYAYEGTVKFDEFYLRGGEIEINYSNGTTRTVSTDHWCTVNGDELVAKCDYVGSSDVWWYDPVPAGTYNVYYSLGDCEQKLCVKNVEVKPVTSMPAINNNGTVTVDNIGRYEAWFQLKTGSSKEYVIENVNIPNEYLEIYTYDSESRSMNGVAEIEGGEKVQLTPNSTYYIKPEAAAEDKAAFKVTSQGSLSAVNMTNCSVSVPKKYTYKGKAVVPSVKVTYKGKELVLNRDYTISCKSNTKIGTASVIITGKGNYTGSVKKTYQIVLGTPAITFVKKSGKDAVKITWKKIAGATQYAVYRYDGKSWKKAGTSTATSFTDKKLKMGVTYKYKLRAIFQNKGKNTYSSYSAVKTIKR